MNTANTALSAEELSALRTAAAGEEPQELPETRSACVKVIAYNFRQPGQLSSTQLRALNTIHEFLAKRILEDSPGGLNRPVQLRRLAVDTVSYRSFIGSLKNPCFMVQLTGQAEAPVLMDMELPVARALAAALLGDSDSEAPDDDKALTSIEQSLAGSWVAKLLPLLTDAWSMSVSVKFNLKTIETDPRFVQVMPNESPLVVLTFQLQIGTVKGRFSICYPLEPLQQMLEGISLKMTGAEEGANDAARNSERLLASLKKVPFELRAELGCSTLLTSQLVRLQLGDVLCLDRSIHEPIDVYLGSRRVFQARLGRKGDALSLQVSARCTTND